MKGSLNRLNLDIPARRQPQDIDRSLKELFRPDGATQTKSIQGSFFAAIYICIYIF